MTPLFFAFASHANSASGRSVARLDDSLRQNPGAPGLEVRGRNWQAASYTEEGFGRKGTFHSPPERDATETRVMHTAARTIASPPARHTSVACRSRARRSRPSALVANSQRRA